MNKQQIRKIVWYVIAVLVLLTIIDLGEFQLKGNSTIVDRNIGFALDYSSATAPEAKVDCKLRGGVQQRCVDSDVPDACGLGPTSCYANPFAMYFGHWIGFN